MPYCAEWTHRAFPALVDRYVRNCLWNVVEDLTPAFQIGKTGGTLQTVPLNSLAQEGLQPAIEETLAS